MDHGKLSNALGSLATPKTRRLPCLQTGEKLPSLSHLNQSTKVNPAETWSSLLDMGDQECSDNSQDERADRRGGSRLPHGTRPCWQSVCWEQLPGGAAGLLPRASEGPPVAQRPAPSAQHWAGLAGLTPLFGPGTHSPFPVALSFPKRIFRPFLLFFFLFSPQVRIKKLAIWNTPNFHWLFYMTPQVTRT